MDYIPTNLKVTDETLAKAKMILTKGENLNIRYIRKRPTVGLALVPVRNKDGEIIGDMPWRKKQVICHGVPTGCMIALVDNGALRIGWSRRFDEKKLIETSDLHAMFQHVILNVQDLTDADDSYQSRFDMFCEGMVRVMSTAPKKNLEIDFVKKEGRRTAVLRALLDDITIFKRFMKSGASGPMPNDIARSLTWFIPQMENKFDLTAANVTKENMDVATAETLAVANA